MLRCFAYFYQKIGFDIHANCLQFVINSPSAELVQKAERLMQVAYIRIYKVRTVDLSIFRLRLSRITAYLEVKI